MSFEKTQFPAWEENKEEKTSPKKAYKIEVGQTPAINTNIAGTGVYVEAHNRRREPREIHEQKLERVRDEILNHYKINKSNSVCIPNGIRDIRAFVVLKSKDNEKEISFFADGNTSHKDLLIALCRNFGNVGTVKNDELPSDFVQKWSIKKGFIDPVFKGFKGYSDLRDAYLRVIEEKHKDEISAADLQDLKSGKADLPNWFVVG